MWMGIEIRPQFVFLCMSACLTSLLFSSELPKGSLLGLESTEFKDRQAAELKLLNWCRSYPDGAMIGLLKYSKSANDPEVRDRCFNILRELVGEQYAAEGEGFIGIKLQDEIQAIPGDSKERSVIRVTYVHLASPGERAGLRSNDVLTGLNGESWYDVKASTLFQAEILKLKPGSRVKLNVLRDAKLMDLEVTLARRPPIPVNQQANLEMTNLEGFERAAKEAHFREWLRQRKMVE